MSVEKILEQRKEQYGKFDNQVGAITTIMNTLRNLRFEKNGKKNEWIAAEDVENFFLVLKLCRMQTSADEDSIRDLIGYAKLIEERRRNGGSK